MEYIIQCNKKAMVELRVENYDDCRLLLKKADQLLNESKNIDQSNNVDHQPLTEFQRNKIIQKPNVALNYMKLALKCESESHQSLSNIASTKLNICAILSLLKKHQKAIYYVYSSINDYEKALEIQRQSNQKVNEESNIPTLLQSMSLAYYNLGVENEHLRNFQQAIDSYEKGLDFAQQTPQGQALVAQFTKSIEEVRVKNQTQNQVHDRRIKLRLSNGTMRFFKDQQHISIIDTTKQDRIQSMMNSLMRTGTREQSRSTQDKSLLPSERLQQKFQQENFEKFFKKDRGKTQESRRTSNNNQDLPNQKYLNEVELPTPTASFFRVSNNGTPLLNISANQTTPINSQEQHRIKTTNTNQIRKKYLNNTQGLNKDIELDVLYERYGQKSPNNRDSENFQINRKSVQLNNTKKNRDRYSNLDVKRKHLMSQSVQRKNHTNQSGLYQQWNQQLKSELDENQEIQDIEMNIASRRELQTQNQQRKPMTQQNYRNFSQQRTPVDQSYPGNYESGQMKLDNLKIQHQLIQKPQFVQNKLLKKHYKSFKQSFKNVLVARGAVPQFNENPGDVYSMNLTNYNQSQTSNKFEPNKFQSRTQSTDHRSSFHVSQNGIMSGITNYANKPQISIQIQQRQNRLQRLRKTTQQAQAMDQSEIIYQRMTVKSPPPELEQYSAENLNKYILASSVYCAEQVQ
eukprot:403359964